MNIFKKTFTTSLDRMAFLASLMAIGFFASWGCQGGIKVIVAPNSTSSTEVSDSHENESTPKTEEKNTTGEKGKPGLAKVSLTEDYWIHYQDWRLSHSDLERDLEKTNIKPRFLTRRFDEVIKAFKKLRPAIPKDDLKDFDDLHESYKRSKGLAQGDHSRDIIRQQIKSIGEMVVQSWSARRLD